MHPARRAQPSAVCYRNPRGFHGQVTTHAATTAPTQIPALFPTLASETHPSRVVRYTPRRPVHVCTLSRILRSQPIPPTNTWCASRSPHLLNTQIRTAFPAYVKLDLNDGHLASQYVKDGMSTDKALSVAPDTDRPRPQLVDARKRQGEKEPGKRTQNKEKRTRMYACAHANAELCVSIFERAHTLGFILTIHRKTTQQRFPRYLGSQPTKVFQDLQTFPFPFQVDMWNDERRLTPDSRYALQTIP